MHSTELQIKALALMMENPIYQLGNFPLPAHFTDPIASVLCKIIRETCQKIGEPIAYEILKDRIYALRKKDPEIAKKAARYWVKMRKPISKIERRYLEDEMAEMCRSAAVQEALLKSVDCWKQGKIDEIEGIMEEALLVGKTDKSLGTFFFSKAPELLNKEQEAFKPIRTLISPLDSLLPHNGICAGDLAVVLALPGYGKSMFLLHVSKAALIQKVPVAYISLEMSEADLSERLIASFSGIPVDRVFEKRRKATREVKRFGKMLGDNLLIKQFPSQSISMSGIGAFLKLVHAQTGFKPGMVVIDYAGEVAPSKRAVRQGAMERYIELGGIFSEMVGYAQREKISVWTGAQANREKGRELITQESIAEAFKGVHVASTIVSLNQDLQQAQNQQMHLFLAKNRKGISKEVIPIFCNFRKGSFYRIVQNEED